MTPRSTLTFLGTGTSSGVPVIGCTCEVCRSADRHDRRLRTSALLQQGDYNLLIDCGPDFRQQMLRLRETPTTIHGVVLTHGHYDHIGGLDDLRPMCNSHPDGEIPIYAPADLCRRLPALMPYCFTPVPQPRVPRFTLHPLEPFVSFSAGPFGCITPLPVEHGNTPAMAYRIGRTAYITDAHTIARPTLDALAGTDTLVINALRHAPHATHLNLQEALDVIDRVGARQAFLTHMSHGIGRHSALTEMLPPHVCAAYDGMQIQNLPTT